MTNSIDEKIDALKSLPKKKLHEVTWGQMDAGIVEQIVSDDEAKRKKVGRALRKRMFSDEQHGKEVLRQLMALEGQNKQYYELLATFAIRDTKRCKALFSLLSEDGFLDNLFQNQPQLAMGLVGKLVSNEKEDRRWIGHKHRQSLIKFYSKDRIIKMLSLATGDYEIINIIHFFARDNARRSMLIKSGLLKDAWDSGMAVGKETTLQKLNRVLFQQMGNSVIEKLCAESWGWNNAGWGDLYTKKAGFSGPELATIGIRFDNRLKVLKETESSLFSRLRKWFKNWLTAGKKNRKNISAYSRSLYKSRARRA